MTEIAAQMKSARTLVLQAVNAGRLIRGRCEQMDTYGSFCGREAEQHHEDYNRPMDVRWLCLAHHHDWHHKHPDVPPEPHLLSSRYRKRILQDYFEIQPELTVKRRVCDMNALDLAAWRHIQVRNKQRKASGYRGLKSGERPAAVLFGLKVGNRIDYHPGIKIGARGGLAQVKGSVDGKIHFVSWDLIHDDWCPQC